MHCSVRDSEDFGFREIREMEMEQVLQAAFNYRGERYNRALRDEATALKDRIKAMRARIERIEHTEAEVRWAHAIHEELVTFLGLVKETRVIRISEIYNRLNDLVRDV